MRAENGRCHRAQQARGHTITSPKYYMTNENKMISVFPCLYKIVMMWYNLLVNLLVVTLQIAEKNKAQAAVEMVK